MEKANGVEKITKTVFIFTYSIEYQNHWMNDILATGYTYKRMNSHKNYDMFGIRAAIKVQTTIASRIDTSLYTTNRKCVFSVLFHVFLLLLFCCYFSTHDLAWFTNIHICNEIDTYIKTLNTKTYWKYLRLVFQLIHIRLSVCQLFYSVSASIRNASINLTSVT